MTDDLDKMIRRYGDELGRAQRRSVSRRLPVRRIAIAGAALGLGLGVGVSVLPGGDPEGGTAYAVKEARKALDASVGILHYKLRAGSAISPGSRTRAVFEQELWRTEAGGEQWRNRFTTPSGGTVETAYANHELRQYYSTKNRYAITKNFTPGPVGMLDPLPMLRATLARGVLRDAGLVTVRGRQLRRLIGVDTVGGGGPAGPIKIRVEYLTDVNTFAPVRVTTSGVQRGSLRSVTDIDAYEVLPLNDETRRLLEVEIPEGATRTTSDAIERESTG